MEQIWWEKVPNAVAFVSDIVENLLNEKSIILSSSGELPWYSYMVRKIKEAVRQQNSSKRFESVMNIQNPGAYLLKELCKPEKRAEYRPSKSYAKFFACSDDIVLHGRYLWIKVSSKEQLDIWTGFVSEYIKERGKNKETAVFILEWIGDGYLQAKKGIKICSFDEYVSEYDRIVFFFFASSSVRERSFIKNYLTELAANVAGNDIELCAACLENYRDFLKNPYAAIYKVVHDHVRSNSSDFTFDKDKDAVNHLIWLAQIKTVFPVLEEYREYFVQRHSFEIAKHLPITSSYGEAYEDPSDVELGTLKYMADNGMFHLSAKEYESLRINKDARNKLSHLTTLSLEEVKKLEV